MCFDKICELDEHETMSQRIRSNLLELFHINQHLPKYPEVRIKIEPINLDFDDLNNFNNINNSNNSNNFNNFNNFNNLNNFNNFNNFNIFNNFNNLNNLNNFNSFNEPVHNSPDPDPGPAPDFDYDPASDSDIDPDYKEEPKVVRKPPRKAINIKPLSQLIEIIYEGETKLFRCKLCNKKVKTKRGSEIHSALHSGIKEKKKKFFWGENF